MGGAEHVEADGVVVADGCDDGVGDGLSGDEVEVGGVGDGAAWVDGDVAAVVACLSVDDGDVHGDGGDAGVGDLGDVVEVEDEWGAGAVEFADGVTTSGVHHPHRCDRNETRLCCHCSNLGGPGLCRRRGHDRHPDTE